MSDHDSSVSGDAIRATPHTVAADGEIFSVISASDADAASEAFWDHVAEEFTIETVYGMRLYVVVDPESTEVQVENGNEYAVEVNITVDTELVAIDGEDAIEQFKQNMGNDPHFNTSVGNGVEVGLRVEFNSIQATAKEED